MGEYARAVYGSCQQPPMAYPFADNFLMEITAIIAANLSDWMKTSQTLDTIKKVAARSGAGFGTVRRAKNGEGNTTIQNLELIARAFGRPTEDLIRQASYAKAGTVSALAAQEPATVAPLIAELVSIAERISDRGQAELIGRAKEVALLHPRAKPNRRAS